MCRASVAAAAAAMHSSIPIVLLCACQGQHGLDCAAGLQPSWLHRLHCQLAAMGWAGRAVGFIPSWLPTKLIRCRGCSLAFGARNSKRALLRTRLSSTKYARNPPPPNLPEHIPPTTLPPAQSSDPQLTGSLLAPTLQSSPSALLAYASSSSVTPSPRPCWPRRYTSTPHPCTTHTATAARCRTQPKQASGGGGSTHNALYLMSQSPCFVCWGIQ